MPKRTDANQSEIVRALRCCGFSVAITSMVGSGFPDIVVSSAMVNVLMEIKDGSKPPSQQKLTPDEKTFHENWRGPIFVVRSAEEAIQIMNDLIKKKCST